jgi:hypothetical protein
LYKKAAGKLTPGMQATTILTPKNGTWEKKIIIIENAKKTEILTNQCRFTAI